MLKLDAQNSNISIFMKHVFSFHSIVHHHSENCRQLIGHPMVYLIHLFIHQPYGKYAKWEVCLRSWNQRQNSVMAVKKKKSILFFWLNLYWSYFLVFIKLSDLNLNDISNSCVKSCFTFNSNLIEMKRIQ